MKQTDRVPHKARGAAQSAGVPAESAGTTKTSYPLMKYLSLLLAVALLFSGVTFARYLSNDRIDASVGIAAFDATYSIDRVNSTTFGNQNYWIETGTSGDDIPQGAGSEITVGITLKNNGDTSVQPTLHLEGPKEYWDHIALQLTTARNVAAGTVLTPQLVIGDIMNAPEESGFNTQSSKDYGSLGDEDATLALSDSVVDVNYVRTATWTVGEGANAKTNKMTITASTRNDVEYAVGFVRQSGDDLLPPIFVDCKKDMTFYSIDLELPALDVKAKTEGGTGEQRVVVWLTWTNDAPNNSQAANENFWESLAKETGSFTIKSQNGENASEETITILGYHFDVSGVPVTDASGNEKSETTTVRIQKTLGSEELEYFHVASINDNDGAYTHTFGECKKITVGDATKTIAQCLNKDESARMYVDLTQFVSEDYQVADAISVSTIRWETDSQTSFQYAPIQQRAFGVSFKATFVQSSEVPKK